MTEDAPYTLLPVVHHDVYPAIDPEGALQGSARGLRILITGASRGIGKATAMALAAAGAHGLALVARTKESLEQTKSQIAAAAPACLIETFTLDVANGDQVRELFRTILAAWGAIDVVVANAGVIEPSSSVADADLSNWWTSYEVNVRGVFNVCQAFLRSRASNGSGEKLGVIIATGDLCAGTYWKGYSAYSATKAAVHRLIEHIDAENSQKRVLAFTFYPGGAPTDMGLSIPEEEHSCLTEDVRLPAAFTVWLATTPAASFLSGRYVDCRWDLNHLLNMKERILEKDLLKLKIAF